MLVKTFQIIWHDKLPVLSCEFHSSGSLVTAGADHEIKVRCDSRSICKLAAFTYPSVNFVPVGVECRAQW